jgi:hypothetical protein
MPPIITAPPNNLEFDSLAELFEKFEQLLLNKSFQCPRGNSIRITRHHFFHLVKLQKGAQTQFTVDVEQTLILATREGLGEYSMDHNRAERLSWIPEILSEPHEILEFNGKQTADEIFLREYDKPGSKFRGVLLKRNESELRIITCMPVARRAARKLSEECQKLWPYKSKSHSG